MNIELIGVVILAGGESSRMGTPKALLTLPSGQTLLDFHINAAKTLNVPILVADNGKNFTKPTQNVVCIADFIPKNNLENGKKGNGALTAIAGAMQYLCGQHGADNGYVKNSYVLVISCDSLIGADKVFDNLKKCENAEVMYAKGEKDYPLLGLYRLDLLPHLIDYLDHGNRAVMKFLANVNANTVNLANNWEILANFNTLAAFDKTKGCLGYADDCKS